MTRHYLAYATANDGWRFLRDLLNFRRMAAFDPGVAQVEIFVAVSEAVQGRESHFRDLGELCRLVESNPRLRVRALTLKPGPGGDFSSWSRCLSAIVEECSPDDHVLCVGRNAFGPLDHGWYARSVIRSDREHDGECASARPIAFAGKPHELARRLAIQAGPPAPAVSPSTPDSGAASPLFRQWRGGDRLSARNLWWCLAWLLDPRWARLAHDPWAEWLASLSELYFLRLEEEIPWSRLTAGPQGSGGATPGARAGLSGIAARIGVHVHLHYQDLWPEMRTSLANLPAGFGLHVTTTTHNAALFASITAEFPGARVTVVPNRGRDIAPFLALLNSGAFDRYDYVCKIHAKKSLVRGRESYFGQVWRRRSIADLLGTPGQVRDIIALFEADPAIGVVGSAVLRQPNGRLGPEHAIGSNGPAVDAFLARCAGREVSIPLDFFAGSMYWFRPRALQAVRAVALAPGDFPAEPSTADGTLAHALERAIPMAATLSGYRVADAPHGADQTPWTVSRTR